MKKIFIFRNRLTTHENIKIKTVLMDSIINKITRQLFKIVIRSV